MTINNLIVPVAVSLIITAVLTYGLIIYFRRRHVGQYIREEGPKAHLKKAGTPTMGGIAIMAGIAVGMFSDGVFSMHKVMILITMLVFGLVGFLDDYEKIAKKNNLGLSPRQKIVLQLIFSILIAVYMLISDPRGTEVFIPFAKVYVDFKWLYIPFVMFVEVAMTNAVNLTDGLDGLAGGTTAIVGIALAAIGIAHNDGILTTTGAVIAASLVGFLIFNKYPAKIFMGDTGSMALGGVLSAVAIITKSEFLLPIAGLIYVLEALSVIIQVTYFRKTGGKRFFRMAPLHHHFELGGMKEYNVVLMFCAFTAVFSVIAYLSA